jgi:hypothetical protein
MTPLENSLSAFHSISLSEMDNVKLMQRIDTKYVVNVSLLPTILEQLHTTYRILEIKGNRQAKYKTLYFDTSNLNDYHTHHRGKANRHKIRMRQYIDSNLYFLEIKKKNNKGRTTKERISINQFSNNLADFNDFLERHGISTKDYNPSLLNSFSRITLVDTDNPQRITIDTNLTVTHPVKNIHKELKNLAVIEIKQAQRSRSLFASALKEHHILPKSISKYGIGIAMLYDTVKYNRFKSKLLYLQKITQNQ